MFNSRRIFLAVCLTLVACGHDDQPRHSSAFMTLPDSQGYYASKTPYEPRQNSRSYEPAPQSYAPVFTQMVARHGSRALTSSSDIDFIKQLLAYALADKALTDLGRLLEPQVVSLEEANVALGYGNLSGRGIMAQVLQDDFFNAVEASRSHRSTLVAELRFAHAETVMPLAALMQLPYSDEQVPVADTYTYDDNAWRGAVVTPYAANMQWEVYNNARGDYVVRMLYNERQMHFKSTCTSIHSGSYYYSFDALKRCYGYQ